jgi:hypothetical protein
MCFVWIWEQTAIISLYSINWLVFVTETECVYCAVRTLCQYKMEVLLVFMIYNVTTGRVCLDTILYVQKHLLAIRPHPQIYSGAHTNTVKPAHWVTKSQLKADGSPQSAAKIRNTWRFLCTLHEVLMATCYLSFVLFLKVYFGQKYLI